MLLPLLLFGFHNRKTILQTQIVRCFHELCQTFFIAVVLLSGIAAHRIDDEVRVDVIPVRVGSHYDFVTWDLLRQLQGNLVRHLRGDRIVGMEGLHHVVVHPPLGAVVRLLGVHELLESALWHTVDACDQRSALIIHLGCLAAVVEDTIKTADSLSAPVLYEVNDCHSITALL